MENSASSC
jgi:hypothetical protein